MTVARDVFDFALCFLGDENTQRQALQCSIRHDEDVARIIRGYFGTLEDGFCEIFERAREAGELKSPIPSRDLARMLVSTGQGLALMSKLGDDPSGPRSVFPTLLRILEGEPSQ